MRQSGFVAAVFLSAFLLFVIQPMAAKAILPIYGGTPAVWTICMMFFQGFLWLAYVYGYVLSKMPRLYGWRLMHGLMVVLSLVFIPITMTLRPMIHAPQWAILSTLCQELSLPLLIIAASAPLIQYAFSETRYVNKQDPYFLYAASNLGSFLALLLYPFVIERLTDLSQQLHYWNLGYGLYMIVLVVCLFAMPLEDKTIIKEKSPQKTSLKEMFRWFSLSFIPCSLMMGVTFYLTTDVAALPLLWIIPLALYLASFVMTFKQKSTISQTFLTQNLLIIVLFPILGLVYGANIIKFWQTLLFHLAGFFAIALFCHRELYLKRPQSGDLTLFYACMATGGLMAGLFNGMIAPALFNDAYEYPFVLILSLLFLPMPKLKYGYLAPIICMVLLAVDYYLQSYSFYQIMAKHEVIPLALVALLFISIPGRVNMVLSLLLIGFFVLVLPPSDRNQLWQSRNFFGVKKVFHQKNVHYLMHHTTLHGFEVRTLKQQNGQQGYYGSIAPIIDLYKNHYQPLHATIVGLGTGMMSCQLRPDDDLTIIEIDKQIIDIAKDKQYFSFLSTCAPHARILLNDGRLAMSEIAAKSQSLIVLDAFSSDAVPIHLLTLEAFKTYQSKLNDNGSILVNISNRHINLLPVLFAIGKRFDMAVFHHIDEGNNQLGQLGSEWILMTRSLDVGHDIMKLKEWGFVSNSKEVLWTDSRASILPLLR